MKHKRVSVGGYAWGHATCLVSNLSVHGDAHQRKLFEKEDCELEVHRFFALANHANKGSTTVTVVREETKSLTKQDCCQLLSKTRGIRQS